MGTQTNAGHRASPRKCTLKWSRPATLPGGKRAGHLHLCHPWLPRVKARPREICRGKKGNTLHLTLLTHLQYKHTPVGIRSLLCLYSGTVDDEKGVMLPQTAQVHHNHATLRVEIFARWNGKYPQPCML